MGDAAVVNAAAALNKIAINVLFIGILAIISAMKNRFHLLLLTQIASLNIIIIIISDLIRDCINYY